jgi:hypothetical protein
MKIRELIEAVDSVVDYKTVSTTPDLFKTQATINGRVIEFTASRDAGPGNTWFIKFGPPRSGIKQDNPKNYLKTGRGGELQVFSFVKQSTEQFANQYKPTSIGFTADRSEANRSGLYQRMIDRWGQEQGYTLNKELSQRLGSKHPSHDFFVLDKTAAQVTNVVTDPPKGKTSMLSGRVPGSNDQITHAYRNMSPAELSYAERTGYFGKNPNPGRTTWDTNQKFWSPGDSQGHFGRSWKANPDNVTVRVPIELVPSNTAVALKHAEILNKQTNTWQPAVTSTPTAAKGMVASTIEASKKLDTPAAIKTLQVGGKVLMAAGIVTQIYRGIDQISNLPKTMPDQQYRQEVTGIVSKLVAEFGLVYVSAVAGSWLAGVALTALAPGVGTVAGAVVGFIAGGAAGYLALEFAGNSVNAIVDKIVAARNV